MKTIERIKEELTRSGGLIFRREEVSALVEYYEATDAWLKGANDRMAGMPLSRLRTRYKKARAALEREE